MTKDLLGKTIKEISGEVKTFNFKKHYLDGFGKDKKSLEDLSYLNGRGGYYCKFLSLLVSKLNLKNVVELGSREGLSTLSIYAGLGQNSKFVTVDLIRDQRYLPQAIRHDERIRLVYGDVCDLDIYNGDIPLDIDLLFSDTIHYHYQIADEFAIYQNFLSDKAIVAIDDIRLNDKGKFFDELAYHKWDLSELCHVSGWGLFLFERKDSLTEQERLFNAYKESVRIWRRKYQEEFERNLDLKHTVFSKLKNRLRANSFIYKLFTFFKRLLKNEKNTFNAG